MPEIQIVLILANLLITYTNHILPKKDPKFTALRRYLRVAKLTITTMNVAILIIDYASKLVQ